MATLHWSGPAAHTRQKGTRALPWQIGDAALHLLQKDHDGAPFAMHSNARASPTFWCISHTVINPVYLCTREAPSTTTRRPKRARLSTSGLVSAHDRLPHVPASASQFGQWRDFAELATHSALAGNLYFTTDSVQLAASIAACDAADDLKEATATFLGDTMLLLPVSHPPQSFLVGLHRRATTRVDTHTVRASSDLPAYFEQDMRVLCVYDGKERVVTAAHMSKYMVRLLEYCNALASQGHMLLADLVATLHLLHFCAAREERCGAVRCMLDKYARNTTQLHAARHEQKIARIAACLANVNVAGAFSLTDTILDAIQSYRPLSDHLVIPVADMASEDATLSSELQRVPSSNTPPLANDSDDVDMSIDDTDVTEMLRLNYVFWDQARATAAGRHIIPLPQYISQSLCVCRNISPTARHIDTTADKYGRRIRAHGGSRLVDDAFFAFLADLYDMGVYVDARLLSALEFVHGAWRIRLPVVMRCTDNWDAVEEGELSLLVAIATELRIVDTPQSPALHGMSLSPYRSLMHAIIRYRIQHLRTGAREDRPSLSVFWRRARDCVACMDTTAFRADAVRKCISHTAGVYTSDATTITIRAAAPDNGPEDKAVYVISMLHGLREYLQESNWNASQLLRRLATMTVKFVHTLDAKYDVETMATGQGTAVQAIGLLWRYMVDPTLGFVAPAEGGQMHALGERFFSTPELLEGLTVAVVASVMYNVMPTLRLHPYMFMIDWDVCKNAESGAHPLCTLDSAHTEHARGLLKAHFDVIFHPNPDAYLEYADSYAAYESVILDHVCLDYKAIIDRTRRDMWNQLFLMPLSNILQTSTPKGAIDGRQARRLCYMMMCPLHNVPIGSIITHAHILRHLKILPDMDAHVDMSSAFQRIISKLDKAHARAFAIFATGKDHLPSGESIKIALHAETFPPDRTVPCPAATTCTRTVQIVYDRTWTETQFEQNIGRLLGVSLDHCHTFGLL